MDTNPLWVIETKQIAPSNFYVKVDGSDYYSAFWVARAADRDQMLEMLNEAISDLDLGETEIISTTQLKEFTSTNVEILNDINEYLDGFGDGDKVRLAVWVSSNGGIQ